MAESPHSSAGTPGSALEFDLPFPDPTPATAEVLRAPPPGPGRTIGYSDARAFAVIRACLDRRGAAVVQRGAALLAGMIPEEDDGDGEEDECSSEEEDEKGSDARETYARALWTLVLKVAEQIPEFHSGMSRLVRIVESMAEMRRLSTTSIGEDGVERIQRLFLLEDVLRHTFRQRSNESSTAISRTTFAALLHAHNLIDARGLLLTHLRQAFEEEPTPPKSSPQDESLKAYILRARVAGCWIVHAGETIVRRVAESEEGDDLHSPHSPWTSQPGWKGGPLVSGKDGFAVERWVLWKRGFSALGGRGWDGAEEVLEAMDVLEKRVEL